jgi:hypothetical protein
MDQIRDIAALGISSILFGICYKRYVKQRNAINGVQVCIKEICSRNKQQQPFKTSGFQGTPSGSTLIFNS